jgi:hypothetical protein
MEVFSGWVDTYIYIGTTAHFSQGTSQEQDSRFADKQKKLLKSMKFPEEYNTKVFTCFVLLTSLPL